jgi:peptidyl-prolyl cis-trans isomerase C
VYSAARALVIRELLQQRIAELGLAVEIAAGENEEEAATRLLLEREVTVPECDEATCVLLRQQSRALSQRAVAGGAAHSARMRAGRRRGAASGPQAQACCC